jgi:uncharacterized membrane protein YphA (DoxX/SURF4 family)
MNGIGEKLANPWLTTRVAIGLGLFFVVASLPKIVDPPSFAHMIYNYRILPGSLINLAALVMPWVELMSGIALILGVWKRSASSIIAAMLVVFIVAISINLARGNAIDCGCFDVHALPKTVEQRIADMQFVVLRDLGMLLMVAQIFWGTRRQASLPIAE